MVELDDGLGDRIGLTVTQELPWERCSKIRTNCAKILLYLHFSRDKVLKVLDVLPVSIG